MPKMKLVNPEGIQYLEDFRSPVEEDPEVKKIKAELPEVPDLLKDKGDNKYKWDLVFVCEEGVVYAHRMVIANASKYIMHMMDDHPPWDPTYIYVLDIPRYIVQLLVDLAYTGEMRIADEIQSDVFDAMSTLGWVHTDCLSSHYEGPGESFVYDHPSPKKEEKQEIEKDKKVTPNPNGASSRKGSGRVSFGEDEDEVRMEISKLPDLNWSDNEGDSEALAKMPENGEAGNGLQASSQGFGQEQKTEERAKGRKRGRAAATAPAKKNENVVPSASEKGDEKKGPSRGRGRGRKVSVPEIIESLPGDDPGAEKNEKPKDRSERKPSVTPKLETPSKPQPPENTAEESTQSSSAVAENGIEESPGKRQRRKPKRFEEYEELDKPKPRAASTSPSKRSAAAESKGKVKTADEPDKTKASNSKNEKANDKADTKGNDTKGKANVGGAKSRPKKQTATSGKNALITSYFKKDSNKLEESSEDLHEAEEEDDAEEDPIHTQADMKKRTFDEILASHTGGEDSTKKEEEHSNSTTATNVEAGKHTQAVPTPIRKSSRVASKESNDEVEDGNNQGEDAPKRKRSRTESVDKKDSPGSATANRRSSKQ